MWSQIALDFIAHCVRTQQRGTVQVDEYLDYATQASRYAEPNGMCHLAFQAQPLTRPVELQRLCIEGANCPPEWVQWLDASNLPNYVKPSDKGNILNYMDAADVSHLSP